MFDNRVLRCTFEPARGKRQETGEEFTVRSFITCALHQVLMLLFFHV
jgi:hypothetical protein